MKKFGIFVLLITSLLLTACNSAYVPKVRISWRSDKETLTYAVSVVEGYTYQPPFNDVDYPATPNEKSSGTYTTSIERTAVTPSIEYTVTTLFEYTLYYSAEGFPSGYGTPDGDYVYFINKVETITKFCGTEGVPFQQMISSVQRVDITDVTKRGNAYNTPKAFNYTLTANYEGKKYSYAFTSAASDLDIYGIDLAGSFNYSGIDNSLLFYYLRAIEMTTDNCSKISSSVRLPDPYVGKMTTLVYGYVKREKIVQPATVKESQALPVNDNNQPYYDCVQIEAAMSGERTGLGIQMYYALNDSYSISLAGYPTRRQQKLIRMRQNYWQYDLIAN